MLIIQELAYNQLANEIYWQLVLIEVQSQKDAIAMFYNKKNLEKPYLERVKKLQSKGIITEEDTLVKKAKSLSRLEAEMRTQKIEEFKKLCECTARMFE